jgi:hypothetical protein
MMGVQIDEITRAEAVILKETTNYFYRILRYYYNERTQIAEALKRERSCFQMGMVYY